MTEIPMKIAAQGGLSVERHEVVERVTLGFWVYLMTDCILFASLFAVYAVLHANTFGGPDAHALFSLPYAFAETMVLLTSSFTCGLAVLASKRNAKLHTLFWLYATCLLGIVFLVLELSEFRHLAQDGNGWQRSGFLSAFFTLVGTHGLHITIGLIWVMALLVKIWRHGFSAATIRRLTLFSMFWHFLDIIWIFIFTVVYAFGVLRV